eukprot:jgi/Undpi1/7085/HiC_scaffold_22.g09559.m1
MFRNTRGGGRDILPTSGNGRSGGGGSMYGAARSSKPALSKSFIATIAWALLSLGLFAGGWTYCSKRLESTSVKCDTRGCKIAQLTNGVTENLYVPRMRMIRGELVRVKNGELADPSQMRRSAQRKLGHTYSIVYTQPDSEDAERKAAIEKKAADYKAAAERKEAQRAKYAEERIKRGKAPVREPDEQKGRCARPMEDHEYDSDDRFPGDAGTMKEKNRDEIARMEAEQGMAAQAHRERSQQAYAEASKRHAEKSKLDMQTKQMGNNLQDRRKNSPDDPDNQPPSPKVERNEEERPKLERGEFQQDLSGAKEGSAEGAVDTGAADVDAADAEIKGLQERLAQLEKDKEMKKAGGRTISSVGGVEDVDTDELSQEDEARREGLPESGDAEEEAGELERGRKYYSLGDFIHEGAAGARRKLLMWKNGVKTVNTPAAKRTREQIDRDASKSRDAHRKGHGHHQKRAKKVAAPVKDEVGATREPAKGGRHHHKAFHHKKEVPMEVEHGWKHQNRQWHGRNELKKLGTTYNLGRSKSRKRKETIDSYVSRRVHTVDFVDSKKWRAVGLWMMIVGFVSASFCLIVGNFQPRPKTKKVS